MYTWRLLTMLDYLNTLALSKQLSCELVSLSNRIRFYNTLIVWKLNRPNKVQSADFSFNICTTGIVELHIDISSFVYYIITAFITSNASTKPIESKFVFGYSQWFSIICCDTKGVDRPVLKLNPSRWHLNTVT